MTQHLLYGDLSAGKLPIVNTQNTLTALANAAGYLHNDGAGALAYVAPALSFLGNASGQYHIPVSGVSPFAYAESGFLIDGTTGGKTILAVTSGKTLTLTATDDYNLTIPATGTVAMLNQENSFTLINPITTPSESWIGPSSTTGVYFKNNNVGIGSDNPLTHFHITQSGDSEYPAAPNLTNAGFYMTSSARTYGLSMGISGSGNAWIQVARNDAATYYNLVLQPNSGNVSIGTKTVSAKFHIVGNADIGQLLVVGHTTQAVATPLIQFARNDAAAGISAMLGLTALGSGANGDGGSILMAGKSSTTAAQSMALDQWLWVNATHASRTARRIFSVYDTVAREALRIEASGTAAMIGFLGANAVVRQTGDIIAGLNNLGLFSGASLKLSGIHASTPITYISGTGTAGVDNTAQTVKSLTLPANALTQVGDRMRIRAYWTGDTGSPVTGSVKIGPSGSEVLVSDTTDGGAATLQLNEVWIHYIDNTHANIIENEAGALGANSAPNVVGFTWNAAQAIIFTQDAISNNHTILYALIVDVFPKGV